MSATFHSTHIRGDDLERVLEALDADFKDHRYTRPARPGPDPVPGAWRIAILPPQEGWMTLYDEGENFRRAARLARGISPAFEGPILWLGVFQDLDFFYELFHGGTAVDAYDSDPSVFDPEEGHVDDPRGTGWLPVDLSDLDRDRAVAGYGHPEILCEHLGLASPWVRGELKQLLDRGRGWDESSLGVSGEEPDAFTWSEEGIEAFGQLLGLPRNRLRTTYEDLAVGAGVPGEDPLFVSYNPVGKKKRHP